MVPKSLGGGIFLREVNHADVRTHVDSTDLIGLFQNGNAPTDFGIIDFFAQRNAFMPQTMSSYGKIPRKLLNTTEYITREAVGDRDFLCLGVVEDDSTSSSSLLGAMGAKFKVRFNHKKYDNLWIVTPDLHAPVAFLITKDEIIEEGDIWVYTLQVQSAQAQDGVSREFFTKNTPFFGTGTIDGEYNQLHSSLPTFNGGERIYTHYVGEGSAQISYSVTREAAMKMVPKDGFVNYEKYLRALQMFTFAPDTLGFRIANMTEAEMGNYTVQDMYRKKYGNAAEAQMGKDMFLSAWMPLVEALELRRLKQMQVDQAYWGTGGLVSSDGRTQQHMPLGLFHQYMRGNKVAYNLNSLSLELLETWILSYMGASANELSPNNIGGVIKVKTGRGGMSLINRLTAGLPSSYGQLQTTDRFLKGGDNRNLVFERPFITGWTTMTGFQIVVEHEPAFDPQIASALNPMVTLNGGMGGFRLSSYMFAIDNLALSDMAENGNVLELNYGPDMGVRKEIRNGKLAYPGTEQSSGVWVKSSDMAGFQVDLRLRYNALHLIDPTRSLMILPINPNTGRAYMDYFVEQ